MDHKEFKQDIERLSDLIRRRADRQAEAWFDEYFEPRYAPLLGVGRWRWFLDELRDYFRNEAKHILGVTNRDYILGCAREVLDDLAEELETP